MAIIDVVKWEGGDNLYAWKYPSKDLSTWTRLIVGESQEAVVVLGGQMDGPFGAGTHTLDTQNLPVISALTNLPFGGESPFSAEVWYVSKATPLNVKWGTASPIQLLDPKFKIMIQARAHGQFGIQVNDTKKFLMKLMGTMTVFDQNMLSDYLRGIMNTAIADLIATTITEKGVSILEIATLLDELSEEMSAKIADKLDEFGLKLINFYVYSIKVPESDPSIVKLREMLAKRAEMDMLRFDYSQERSFDVMETAAGNEGSTAAGMMGAGMGLGLGVGVGQPMGMTMGGMVSNLSSQPQEIRCASCGNFSKPDANFCAGCGKSFDSKSQEKTDGKVTCAKCNHSLDPDSAFCQACGKAVNTCPACNADNLEGALNCDSCKTPLPRNCSKCGTENASDNKFCKGCGTSLTVSCGKCGTAQADASSKFCSSCGEEL